jgi:hypothetical protein
MESPWNSHGTLALLRCHKRETGVWMLGSSRWPPAFVKDFSFTAAKL